ncbi:hypothetical protein [Serratia quinivorans]|uniref:hypothetical protein n=1 Tax=Serratia quinivorans TaxID=137545 RepID=UPI0021BD2F17|nr:hypothetical protein [Serratia quinivorans]
MMMVPSLTAAGLTGFHFSRPCIYLLIAQIVILDNRKKVALWLKDFPGTLNDIGDAPVFKRRDGWCW